jgi:ABC-type transport system substrate-binding protein
MSSRQVLSSAASAVAVLALLAACGGATKETGEAAPAPAAAPEATPQAANDPADAAAPAEPSNYDPATAAGAVKGVPAPTNSAPIEAVANFFTELPGFDLASLSTRQRDKFLHRVNSEICTCGCKNDTLARCLVNDPKCPAVKGMVQTVYDEIKSGK